MRIALAVALLALGLAPPAARADDADLVRATAAPANAVWLEDLDLTHMSAGWGTPQARLSCEKTPLTLKGVVYPHGVGTHAVSEMIVDLKGAVSRFVAMVGLDDERAGKGSITFEVWADDQKLADTGVLHGGDAPKLISVDLTGRKTLALLATDADDGIANDHADWAGAMLILAPGATARPAAAAAAQEPAPVLARDTSTAPAIHGPRVTGTTPGYPFLFRIPATGEGPLTYAASGLPRGLKLDAATGIISGSVEKEGTYAVRLTAKGPKGQGSRTLRIVAGKDKLALTPPMGWNSWYVWFDSVDQAKMEAAADWMVKSGLAAHGYQYVNIDDCWMGERDAAGAMQGNAKFPDLKALGDHIHNLGLRFGIYTSPGPKTCAGYTGSYGHEDQDARTFASWGVDFLKHDWCSYGSIAKDGTLPELKKPYAVMRDAIRKSGRDMVYNLCQYGMGDVWKWGTEVGSNCWRTTGDSGDTWAVVSSIGFFQSDLAPYAGPGHWNDPDYLQVGLLGGATVRPTRLAPNEQITQVSLWSLIAAPLVLSCDMTRLDDFTLALLTNDEVIDVDQDPLGKAGHRVAQRGRTEVWSRPLWDGTIAVGLFNRGLLRARVTANWADIGATGSQPVRDLWQRKSLGAFRDSFSAEVPPHGAVLIKVGRPKRMD